MEKFQKSDQFYKQNKFVECCETLRRLLPHLTGKCTEDPHFILECMVTNNLNVCSALAEIVKNSFENSWEPKLRNFISHFNNWRSSTVLPLQLLLTLGYNVLHWYWMMPKSQKRKDRFYYEILDIAEECFKKVLEESNVNIIGHSDQVESEENLMWLMESATNQIPKLNHFLTVALIKLLNILYLIFMKKQKSSQFFQCSFHSNEKQMQGIRQLEKSHKTKSDRKTKSSSVPSTKSGYYTFGFKNLNSTFDDTADACATAFYLTCTLNIIVFNGIEKAADYLRGYEISDKFSSLALYLRAYCLFHLNHLDEAYMTLSSTQNQPLNDHLKFHVHILLGKYFSEKKMLKEATTEFMKAKSISTFLAPEALYHLFKSCQKDNSLMQVRFLDEIHQSIKKSGGSTASWKMSEAFESRLLSMLHMYPAISEEEVLYLLAKVNLQHKKYAVAEKFYSKLLTILKTSCDIVIYDSVRRLAPLPGIRIIHHETIKCLIDSDNPQPEVALKLGQSCLDDFIPSSSSCSHSASNSDTGTKYFDEFLNSLDEDCISLILLSQTYFQMNEDSKALDLVERCTEIVSRYIDSKKSDISITDQNSSKSEELTFFKCFLAKLFLCKAILLKNMGKNTKELIPLCKKALSFNNGDSDVLFYYAQFLTKQNQHEEAAVLRSTKRFDLDPERCFNEALKSFIELHAQEENWGESDSPEDMVADLFENSGDYF